MVDLKELHKQFVLAHLGEGEVAVDFTMGNGNDTLFLSRTVGEQGRVYAFDIQEEALKSTRDRLTAENAPENYTLICASHHRVREFVREPIKAGMFNLGYLPGSGRKGVTTLRQTTMAAVEAAIEMLLPDGVLIVAIYPGHEEGELEGEMLREYFSTLSRYQICPSLFRILNSPTSPYFFLVEKSAKAPMPTLSTE
ncbi:MAG: methyltransferase domain-containing protein [Clostridia bacterium]|nr:methyltransferase domain-containing protein [Clostridia bacterium]